MGQQFAHWKSRTDSNLLFLFFSLHVCWFLCVHSNLAPQNKLELEERKSKVNRISSFQHGKGFRFWHFPSPCCSFLQQKYRVSSCGFRLPKRESLRNSFLTNLDLIKQVSLAQTKKVLEPWPIEAHTHLLSSGLSRVCFRSDRLWCQISESLSHLIDLN